MVCSGPTMLESTDCSGPISLEEKNDESLIEYPLKMSPKKKKSSKRKDTTTKPSKKKEKLTIERTNTGGVFG